LFKLLDAREMFRDNGGQLLAPCGRCLQFLAQMIALVRQALRQFDMLFAIKQRSLQTLAKIMILQSKTLDPCLKGGLFEALFVEVVTKLLLGGDQGVELDVDDAQARRHVVHIDLRRTTFSPGLAQLCFFRTQGVFGDRHVIFEVRNDPGAAADLTHVLGAILRHRINFSLKATLFDGGLRAKLVAFGDGFRHGQGHQHFEATHRQAHGPPPEGRQNQKGEESRDQEPQREYHGLFDQGDNRMSIF
jgi:hypothetical protein